MEILLKCVLVALYAATAFAAKKTSEWKPKGQRSSHLNSSKNFPSLSVENTQTQNSSSSSSQIWGNFRELEKYESDSTLTTERDAKKKKPNTPILSVPAPKTNISSYEEFRLNLERKDLEAKAELENAQILKVPERRANIGSYEEFRQSLERKDVEAQTEMERKKKQREERRKLFRQPEVKDLMPQPILNVGNTCFLNSILQCFGALRKHLFTVYIDDSTQVLDPLAVFMADLLNRNPGSPLDPTDIISSISGVLGEYFDGEQHDAAEVLMRLYGKMFDDQKDKRAFRALIEWNEARSSSTDDTSQAPVVSHFEPHMIHSVEILPTVQTKSTLDKTKERTRIEREVNEAMDAGDEDRIQRLFTELGNLDGKQPIPLSSLIKAYYSEEDVGGRKKSRLRRVGALPTIYTIALKRFIRNAKTGKLEKNKDPVCIPEYLEVASEPFLDVKREFHSVQKAKYRMKGVILHRGELGSGHYAALVRIGDAWFLCDDAKVERKDYDIIANGNYGEFTPYVLFYEKQMPAAQ